jgi:hypothetical protein
MESPFARSIAKIAATLFFEFISGEICQTKRSWPRHA